MLICILTKNVITSCSVTMMLFLHLEVKPLMTLTTVLYLSCALISGHLAMMLMELTKRREASFLVVFNRPINILCRVSLFLSMALCLLLRLFVFRLLRLKRFQYFCVPEYGTANGRLHFHAVHFMRTLPTGSVDPNFGRRVRNRRQLNSLQNTWPYGYSMPIAVRYTQDAFSRSGWLWPVDA